MFNIFGSEDSQDYDVMMILDSIPESKQLCHELCTKYESELSDLLSSKELNVNLSAIKEGRIVQSFKGTYDECNNSIYQTYHLHKQYHPLLITGIVERNVPLKVARSLRIILSFLSRTPFRSEVKAALKNDYKYKIKVLRSIDFSELESFEKNSLSTKDVFKTFAFQIGQTTALIQGKELYTKSDIMKGFPLLEPFLKRQYGNLRILNKMKNDFFDLIESCEWKEKVME